jgi:cytochrome P450
MRIFVLITMSVVQAESANSGTAITEEEVTSQVRTIIAAGYETTSCQHRLRALAFVS